MNDAEITEIRQKLAVLAARPETSFALAAYLRAAADRDIVDVLNEIEALAALTGTGLPVTRPG